MRWRLLSSLLVVGLVLVAAVSRQAVQLRNLGLAQLENEQTDSAEDTFRQLSTLTPGDPLPFANAAIAALRQQKTDEALEWIAPAIRLAPDDSGLLAIHAEILQWAGRSQEAHEILARAAAAAPDDVHVQYAALRQAQTVGDPETEAATVERLAALRPDNLFVILQQGRKALERTDRAAASAAFLRVRELTWQAPVQAEGVLDQLLEALDKADFGAARVPALRLANLLKVTPMYQQGLRDLTLGIQGQPVLDFVDEPSPTAFGDPVAVTFRGRPLAEASSRGAAVAVGDLDGDQRPDIAWTGVGESNDSSPATAELLRLELTTAGAVSLPRPGAGGGQLRIADLDNDGHLDLLDLHPQAIELWRGDGAGGFSPAAASLGLEGARATTGEVFDFDAEGDLDLVVGLPDGGLELYRNIGDGPLETVGERVFPETGFGEIRDLRATDLDRDGDLDLVVAHADGLGWLENLRQGRFRDRTEEGGLRWAPAARSVLSADLDNDGWPDLVVAGRGIHFFHNVGGRFELWAIGEQLRTTAEFHAIEGFDADNDGRLDIAVAGERSLVVLAQSGGMEFRFLPIELGPGSGSSLASADLDRDGDLDLVSGDAAGLFRFDNDGGNANHWLSVGLRGLVKGNSKNNHFGLGATVEAHVGRAYQLREVTGEATHLGLGRRPQAEVLRVVWSNGVPQNRLDVGADQTVVEEQVLKGSCPFLYTWDGEEIRFVTDLLWGAPLGMPIAEGLWASADPHELVLVEGARDRQGIYDLRITEELWETAYFDLTRLWVVDLPIDAEAATSLRILPGESVADRVLASRELRPAAAAWDGRGDDVTEIVAVRDRRYADGWQPSRYQGVAADPWSLTFDLGEAPNGPIRLHLDGWIFPADASLNLAMAQRPDFEPMAPRLEVETAEGWRPLIERMGHPAGKTKTMVIDTPPLPPGASRLRIVSRQWLGWDRVAWTTAPADNEIRVLARLRPSSADLHRRGFSALVRQAPNAPHEFDYSRVRSDSPWLPIAGPFTRYGDVGELLETVDDRSVVMAPGDELVLRFDASGLGPPEAGRQRVVVLESHGWDKDADRNTYAGERADPFPFAGMSGYPFAAGESYPDTPLHRAWLSEWQTREGNGADWR